MRRLPAEVSCSIFEQLSFAERISATHICKRWRRIALGHGWLWSRIRCRDAGTLATLLERSHGVPVDVQVTDISPSNYEEIVSLIGAHLGHLRLLALHAGNAKLELDCVSAVHRALARAAPLLRVVDIQLFNQPLPQNTAAAIRAAHVARAPCVVPADSFLHQAPGLQQLSFQTMTLPWAGPNAFSEVNILELDAIYLSAAQMTTLVSMARLRSMHLIAVDCELPKVPAPSTFKLDALWIDGLYSTPHDDPVDPVLRYLGYPHIRQFTSDWQSFWPEIVSAPRSLPHTLHVERWQDDSVRTRSEAWRLFDGAGFVTDFLDVYTCDHFSWPDHQAMLANLGTLVVIFRELATAIHNAVEFRNLTRLCARVSEKDCTTTDWDGIAAIPAPQLRTLELWGELANGETTVAMREADVLNVVRDFLALNCAHPPELVLCDVALVESAEEGTALEELVAGIWRVDGPAPASFVNELKDKWHASVRP